MDKQTELRHEAMVKATKPKKNNWAAVLNQKLPCQREIDNRVDASQIL